MRREDAMPHRSREEWPAPEDASDEKVLADVEEHGWHMIGIEADEEGPAFAYTIGLYETFGQPEVILFGLDTGIMFRLLNQIGEQVREGRRFGHGSESA